MVKITFMGAGSTVFAKNVLGDAMLSEALRDSEIALYDIDAQRLRESQLMLEKMNRNINKNRARVTMHLGVARRKEALRKADFVVNAIQVGGYKPSTVIDFEIPKKYGLRQTIADTLGIGGIFRALRTIPVMLDFARDMEAVCPSAWFLNYTNPMAMLTGAMQQATNVKTVGLCHSVQCCAEGLLRHLGLNKKYPMSGITHKIAGINHMAWLLEISYKGKDIYPEIKKVAAQMLLAVQKRGGAQKVAEEIRAKCPDYWSSTDPLACVAIDAVRLQMMLHFGYYITESSEHNAEYTPYWIKKDYPELI